MEQGNQQVGESLHRRVVNGETLAPEELREYERWCAAADSRIDTGAIVERIKALRATLRNAQARKTRMLEREKELLRRIEQIEAHLDSHTRDLLGIGS
jgi:hypothetical protein